MEWKAQAPVERGLLSRWARALFAAGFLAGAVAVGISLQPSAPLAKDIVQPTITIFASRPGVSSVVTMSSYPNLAVPSTPSTGASAPTVPAYEFQIGLKVLSPQTKRVTFVLLLSDFPRVLSPGLYALRSASGIPSDALAGELPLPSQDAPGRADYLAFRTFVPATPAAARVRGPSEPTVKLATQYSLVSRSSGSELQVAFPVVQDEKPALTLALSPAAPIFATELLAAYANPPTLAGSDRGPYYEPDLEPGNTLYHPDTGVNLPDYQELAGTPPLIRPPEWSWTGVGDVSLLSQDALTAVQAQDHLFWAGVAWGVAAAAGIAALLEFISAYQEERARRARKRARERGATGSDATGSDEMPGRQMPGREKPGREKPGRANRARQPSGVAEGRLGVSEPQ